MEGKSGIVVLMIVAFVHCQVPLLVQLTEPTLHAEGPVWDPIQQLLFYVDIPLQTVHRYDPYTGEDTSVYIEGGQVTPVLVVEGKVDEFVLGRDRDLLWMRWDGYSETPNELKFLTRVQSDKPGNRFNDGKADSMGRVWAGTMKDEDDDRTDQGAFFKMEYSNHFAPQTLIPNVTISNGLAWNDDDTLMYYIDSTTKRVDVFDFNSKYGLISNRRSVFHLLQYGFDGIPDGMSIDSDGNLWVAIFGGWSVLKINPRNGALLQIIQLPAAQVTSCAFGGPLLDILFITTSKLDLSEDQIAQQPLAGAVFALTAMGVTGQAKPNKVIK